jgi:hypothetical protein
VQAVPMHALALMLALTQIPKVESVKVFRGPEGQLVELATLEPRASKKLLVRVRGADSEHDGLVVPCVLENEDVTTTHRGADWNLLVLRGESREVYLAPKHFQVKFDQAATDAFNAEELLSAFASQGSRRALFARREWPTLEKKYQAAADAAAAKLNKPCAHAVAFSFDWSSFPDTVMAAQDVWKACEPALAQAQKNCPATVTCRGGIAAGVSSEGEVLVFTVNLK